VRAWEVLEATGQSLDEWQKLKGTPVLTGNLARFVVKPNRDWLRAQIARRFDAMMAQGALEEVRALGPISDELPAARALGVPQLMAHLRGIFGYPGGAVLPIYDALFQQEKVRTSWSATSRARSHAAEGYARSTGKVGVVLVTSGPGATNAVTGLTDALMDSIPMVCITGQVPTHLIGNDAFQECDTVGITRPAPSTITW
jgi:hypothetical protein